MSYKPEPHRASPREYEEGLVLDRDGRAYVAIHPYYSATSGRRKRILIARLVVCLLALLAFVFTVIGHVVPFADNGRTGSSRVTYAIWQERRYTSAGTVGRVRAFKDVPAAQAFGILTTLFAAVGLVLVIVFAALWKRHERIRVEEESANERLQSKYGQERSGGEDSSLYSFPYENQRVANDGLAVVAFEEAERKRQQLDRSIGISAFSIFTAAALCALITVIVLATYYNEELARRSGKQLAGMAMFIVALVLVAVAFVVLAIPPATGLFLCCPPSVRRAELMVLQDSEQYSEVRQGSRAQVEAYSRDGHSASMVRGKYNSSTGEYPQHQLPPPPQQQQPAVNPFYPSSGTESGAAGVAQGIPMALPGPSIEELQQQQQQQQQEREREREYPTGAYFQPAPQLFNVDADRKKKNKAVYEGY